MKALVWLRSDIRLNDNPAIRQAFEQSKEVHAIFFFSNTQLKKHNEACVKIDFLINNLFSLERKLSELNVPLFIINSSGYEDNPSLISKYVDDKDIDKVFWNNQFGED